MKFDGPGLYYSSVVVNAQVSAVGGANSIYPVRYHQLQIGGASQTTACSALQPTEYLTYGVQ